MFTNFSIMVFLLRDNLSLIYVIGGILIFFTFPMWQISSFLHSTHIIKCTFVNWAYESIYYIILYIYKFLFHGLSPTWQSILYLCNRWHSYIFMFPMWQILRILSNQVVTISDIYIIYLQVSPTGQSILNLYNQWYSYIFKFSYK
jgi:hypothetical protein